MRVTRVERAHGVVKVAFSDEETLCVPSAVFRDFIVREGDGVDRKTYEKLIADHAYPYALDRAAKLLAARDYTEKEIERRLKAAAYGEETVARVMAALAAHDFVSDERYAGRYVARCSAKYGRMRIYQEMKRKGVPEQTAREALDELPEEDELAAARAQARKILARRRCTDAVSRQKALAALVRRGFSFGVAKNALQAETEDNDDDLQEYD